jgi:hypothetical protein
MRSPLLRADGRTTATLVLAAARLELGEVEDAVDQLEQELAVAARDVGPLLALGIVALAAGEQPDVAEHGGHRRADLVAHVRQEVALGPVRGLGLIASGHQVAVHLGELGQVAVHDLPGAREAPRHVVDRLGELAELVRALDLDPGAEVASPDAQRRRADPFDRPHHTGRDQQAEHQGRADGSQAAQHEAAARGRQGVALGLQRASHPEWQPAFALDRECECAVDERRLAEIDVGADQRGPARELALGERLEGDEPAHGPAPIDQLNLRPGVRTSCGLDQVPVRGRVGHGPVATHGEQLAVGCVDHQPARARARAQELELAVERGPGAGAQCSAQVDRVQ